ncbi:MAG: hypothetical protein IT509_13130 [Rhodocyclaceae bacterium]|nr:hypothetical protein [Rhodocyclaceae bacterium]
MTVTLTGGAAGLGVEWGYVLYADNYQCFGATIEASGAMRIRLKSCGQPTPDGVYFGTGFVTATTLSFDRLNAFPPEQRGGVLSSDFVGTRVP